MITTVVEAIPDITYCVDGSLRAPRHLFDPPKDGGRRVMPTLIDDYCGAEHAYFANSGTRRTEPRPADQPQVVQLLQTYIPQFVKLTRAGSGNTPALQLAKRAAIDALKQGYMGSLKVLFQDPLGGTDDSVAELWLGQSHSVQRVSWAESGEYRVRITWSARLRPCKAARWYLHAVRHLLMPLE